MISPLQEQARQSVAAERLLNHLEWFATVRRDTGGPGEERAARYIAEQLAADGVPVTLHAFDAFLSYPIAASLTVAGPEPVTMRCITHSFAPSTGPEGLTVTLAYPPAGQPELAVGQAALFDEIATPVTILRAGKAGCAAAIFVNPGPAIHNMIGTTIWGTPALDQLDRLPALPVISIDSADGARLKTLLAQGGPVTVQISTEVRTGWTTSLLPEVRIPGADEAEGFVLVGAHYCSWDVGITDNATGDACLLEMARILWEQRGDLRRGVRIAWWPGHSHGRYSGSTWYADTFFTDLAEGCVAYHNIDSPGVRGATKYVARHTSAEIEGFCRDVIDRVTGQAGAPVHRPSRAADQSFLANGVPSFSTYPFLPDDHPDRRPWTGGCANAWWWHTEHDTLDKADIAILTLDTQVSLTAVLDLTQASVLPFDHRAVVAELSVVVEGLHAQVGEHLDLEPVIAELRAYGAALERLEAQRLLAEGHATRSRHMNRTLIRLSRIMNPVIYSQSGRFAHDAAEWSPIMRATGMYTLAALTRAAQLPELAGQFAYGFLRAQVLRERNRVVTALREATRLAEDAAS